MTTTPETLTIKEVANLLGGVAPDTVYLRAARGDIPAAKIGGSWVFLKADIIQHIRARYKVKTDAEGKPWGSTNEKAASSGTTNSRSTDALYVKALGLNAKPTLRKPKRTGAASCGSKPSSV